MWQTVRAGASILLSIIAVIGLPSEASAQRDAERTALARELFGQGLAHLEEERFEEAAQVLERAYEVRSASGIGYNLGTTYEKLRQ